MVTKQQECSTKKTRYGQGLLRGKQLWEAHMRGQRSWGESCTAREYSQLWDPKFNMDRRDCDGHRACSVNCFISNQSCRQSWQSCLNCAEQRIESKKAQNRYYWKQQDFFQFLNLEYYLTWFLWKKIQTNTEKMIIKIIKVVRSLNVYDSLIHFSWRLPCRNLPDMNEEGPHSLLLHSEIWVLNQGFLFPSFCRTYTLFKERFTGVWK